VVHALVPRAPAPHLAAAGGARRARSRRSTSSAYAADAERYCLARFKPRGWTWIDPSSDLDAYEKRCAAASPP
jgi:capsid protein